MTFRRAFTIVELIIVIVVIGILAAITIIGYSSVTGRATISALQSDLNQAAKQLDSFKQTNSSYPVDLATANIKDTSNTKFTYYSTTNNTQYCITAKDNNSTYNYSVSSSNLTPQSGKCTTNGLVGWWKLNGNTLDSSGLSNNLTSYGSPSLANDKNNNPNNAYYFNGTTDYMQVNGFTYGVIGSSNYNSQWSLSIWAKWATIYTSEAVLIGRSGCNGGIALFNNNNPNMNRYTFMIKGSGCWSGSATAYDTSALDTNWHFLVATYDNGLMNFYDNGSLQGTATLSSMYPNYNSCFGVGSTCGQQYMFNGTLDDARVYNRTLSQGEVTMMNSDGPQ